MPHASLTSRGVIASLAVAALLAGVATGASASPATRNSTRERLSGAQPVWLCQPNLVHDPCTAPSSYESITANGTTTEVPLTSTPSPSVDCFYVYPTVSTESGENANLAIQPAETNVARDQASPFSSECNVWAPMYKQITLKSLFSVSHLSQGLHTAFASLLAGWKDYLANDNDGRPFVLIGHSQGAAMLIKLIQTQIDPNPAVRQRMVSAIILGGNVVVPTGKLVGGSFRHVPACTSTSETGCVIAYSSFLSTPPTDSLFGRPGQGVSAFAGQTATKGVHVLCVNPADPGGTAPIDPLLPQGTGPSTQWFAVPGLYSAGCKSRSGATWLQVNVHHEAGDRRPVVTQSLGPTWGLHRYDVNLTLLNLLAMVGEEISAFTP